MGRLKAGESLTKKSRAFVLAAVFFVMVVIILLIASLFQLVPQEVRWSGDHRRDTLAYYTASAGAKHALAWLRQVRLAGSGANEPFERSSGDDPYQVTREDNPGRWPLRLGPETDLNPDGDDTYFPRGLPVLRSRPGRIRLPGDWCAEVHIFPDKRTPPHPFLSGAAGTRPPCYIIVALAFRDVNGNGVCDNGGGENYSLRLETSAVERTYARYAYFVDRWPDTGGTTPALAVLPSLGEPLFSGPVHSNDTPVIQVLDAARFWAESPFVAPFADELSFAGDTAPGKAPGSYDGVAYLGGNFRGVDPLQLPYQEGSPQRPLVSRYARLFKGSQAAIRRTQRIQLPVDWGRIAKAAWGVEAGREVPVDSAPQNRVFINRQDLGVAVTGSLRELRLDLVDAAGRSLVYDATHQLRPNVGSGSQLINLVQASEVSYIAGYSNPTIETVTSETGPYTLTETLWSDTPQAGYVATSVREQVGTTTETVMSNVLAGSTVINDPPGGAGPATGGRVVIPRYISTPVTVTLPLYEYRNRYVMMNVVTGDGPHDVTSIITDTSTSIPIISNYAPQDCLVVAKDSDVVLPVNYFVTATDVGADQFPAFVGATTALQIRIPRGKTLVARQDRADGRTFTAEILDNSPNGVIAVYGSVSGLSGVNRDAKTILVAGPASPPTLQPTVLGDAQISDELLYFGVTPGSMPRDGRNSLGLVAANITLDASATTLTRFSASNPFYLYGSFLAAQGGLRSGPLPTPAVMGELRVVGGVIQQSIGTLLEGGAGWSSRYRYDRFLTQQPPPSFPPDGRYDITFFRVSRP